MKTFASTEPMGVLYLACGTVTDALDADSRLMATPVVEACSLYRQRPP